MGTTPMAQYIYPVSYTHLDVYKRQVLWCLVIEHTIEIVSPSSVLYMLSHKMLNDVNVNIFIVPMIPILQIIIYSGQFIQFLLFFLSNFSTETRNDAFAIVNLAVFSWFYMHIFNALNKKDSVEFHIGINTLWPKNIQYENNKSENVWKISASGTYMQTWKCWRKLKQQTFCLHRSAASSAATYLTCYNC